MDDWRPWARAGLWSQVDLVRVLMDGDPKEITGLRDALRLVVPVLPPEEAGTSLLTPERRAVPSDTDFLRKHVEEGNYCRAMLQLQGTLAPAQEADAERHVEQVQRRLEERVGSEFELQARELRHASAHLEELELCKAEEERQRLMVEQWERVDRSAVEKLAEECIGYCGLDETYVEVDVQKRQVRSARELGESGDTGGDAGEQRPKASSRPMSLRNLTTPDSPIAHSKVWHAASLLCLAEALRRELDISATCPEDVEPWSDDEGDRLSPARFECSLA